MHCSLHTCSVRVKCTQFAIAYYGLALAGSTVRTVLCASQCFIIMDILSHAIFHTKRIYLHLYWCTMVVVAVVPPCTHGHTQPQRNKVLTSGYCCHLSSYVNGENLRCGNCETLINIVTKLLSAHPEDYTRVQERLINMQQSRTGAQAENNTNITTIIVRGSCEGLSARDLSYVDEHPHLVVQRSAAHQPQLACRLSTIRVHIQTRYMSVQEYANK